MITVGLTGGIACGKSTVSELLRRRGVPVLDLDQVAREVVAPGTPGFLEVATRWPDVMRNGAIDRKALGAIVVSDPVARRALEQVTHPRIRARAAEWMASQAAPIVVVEAALLVETGSWRLYDKLLVVTCSPATQRARLAAREGYDAETVEKWLATQMPLAEKERVATAVIHNDGDLAALAAEVDRVWAAIVGG